MKAQTPGTAWLKLIGALLTIVVTALLFGLLLGPSGSESHLKAHGSHQMFHRPWTEAHAKQDPIPSIDPTLWKRFSISKEPSEIHVDYPPTSYVSPNIFPFKRHTMPVGGKLEVDGATMEFVAVGTAWRDADEGDQEDMRFNLFGYDLQPLPDDAFPEYRKELEKSGKWRDHHVFPRAKFAFLFDGWENGRVRSMRVFNADSWRSLCGTYSSNRADGLRVWSANFEQWHSSNIEIVTDIAYGPATEATFPLEPGKGFGNPTYDIRYVDRLENVESGETHESDHARERLIIRPEAPGGVTRYLFATQFTATRPPVEVTLLDKKGKEVPGYWVSNDLCQSYITNEGATLAVSAHVEVLPKIARVSVMLPHMLGLPPENLHVDNLFDVKVPYVKFKFGSGSDAPHFLTQALGAGVMDRGPNRSSGPFEREFKNATVGEITQSYADFRGAVVDINSSRYNVSFDSRGGRARLWESFVRMF